MKKIINRAFPLVLCLWLLVQTVSAELLLVPGGQVVGLQLKNDTVTVTAFDGTLGGPAKDAGLQVGDRIVRIDAQTVCSAEDIRQALSRSDGEVDLRILRNGKTKTLHVQPVITDEGPRLGVYLKEGITGIGTVTWYDAQTGQFGALGHGVSDPEGKLVTMESGGVFSALVQSVRKGQAGEPGQLMGTLTDREPIGVLDRNRAQGVFGKLETAPAAQPLPVSSADQVRPGPATIRSTVADTQVQEYSVEILKIYPHSGATGRNMLLKITDERLLSATGGIVQGMSGSPIIQNGKLVGAVTHVLVNDPTTGYGIFIENMLDAAA